MKLIFLVGISFFLSTEAYAWTVIKNFEDGVLGERAQSPDGFDGTAGASKFSDLHVVDGNQSAEVNATAGQEGFGQWGGSFGFPSEL